jgi:phage-related protein
MTLGDKPLVWMAGEVKSPPFSPRARLEAGFLLRRLQGGEIVSLPHARPMPGIGRRCYELRIRDQSQTRRIIYRLDADAVVVVEVFNKKTPKTPLAVLEACRRRLLLYDRLSQE